MSKHNKHDNQDTLVRLFNKMLVELSRTPKDNVVRFRIVKKKLQRLAERLKVVITNEQIERGALKPIPEPKAPSILDTVIDHTHHNEKLN